MVANHERRLAAEGVAIATLQIDKQKFKWPMYVAAIPDSLLLGSDILDAIDLVVSCRRGLLVGDTWVSCEVSRRPVDVRAVTVFTSESCTIPPEHEMMVQVPLNPDQMQGSREAVLEPLVDERGLLLARSLVSMEDKCIPIGMVNLSQTPIKLPRGHPLGELQPVVQQVTVFGPPLAARQLPTEGPSTPTLLLESGANPDTGEAVEPEEPALEDIVTEEAEAVPEHLRSLYINTALGVQVPSVRGMLCQLLSRRECAFARHKLDLGHCTLVEHEINTACAAPVKERVRPTPRGFEDEEKRCLDEQLEAGVIRPSSSAWAAATVLVRKADGSVRFYVDYRKLNDRTSKDAYPLPKISMCLDSLGGTCYFSTLDLQSGYWQIGMAEADIPKTAFITKYGLYKYTKMPFGLCSAPGTFQRCMELIFRGLQWQTLLIYLDDLIIIGASREENLLRLDEVLGRLEDAGLKLKPSKCQLLQKEVLFLGHVISEQGVQPNPRLIEAVKEWAVPSSRKEVQQYLGLVNYYRRFVPEFSSIAVPLTELTSKQVEFHWSEEAQQAFERLKEALCSAPVLSFPRDEGELILDTDASAVGIGVVLHQKQDDEEKVVAYGSNKLNKQQRRYCGTKRELFAIVVFLREFHHYLLGKPFLIRTDHSSFTWLLQFKEPQGQLARWMEYIYQFQFSIAHREGKKHGNADALSRVPPDQGSCDAYHLGTPLTELPCKGCTYCSRRHEEWADFSHNVDDVVPLSSSCRQVVTRSQAAAKAKPSPGTSADTGGHGPVPGSPVEITWVEGYSLKELREAQLKDPDLGLVHGLGLGLQVLYSVTNCTGNILGRFTNITSNRTRLQCSRYKQRIFKYNHSKAKIWQNNPIYPI